MNHLVIAQCISDARFVHRSRPSNSRHPPSKLPAANAVSVSTMRSLYHSQTSSKVARQGVLQCLLACPLQWLPQGLSVREKHQLLQTLMRFQKVSSALNALAQALSAVRISPTPSEQPPAWRICHHKTAKQHCEQPNMTGATMTTP